ncbi:MAG: hypothetical protein E7355_01975 [Clostridiales bacterium]|nr:hypothetical protein [Clostridiales bacterium]
MKRIDLFELLDNEIGVEQKKWVEDWLFEKEKNGDWDQSNKGKSWTDEELKVVLSFAPTKENCLLLAKAFKRGYGSIEQIFRWATTDMQTIKNSDRKDDAFVLQVKRIYKEMGWRA